MPVIKWLQSISGSKKVIQQLTLTEQEATKLERRIQSVNDKARMAGVYAGSKDLQGALVKQNAAMGRSVKGSKAMGSSFAVVANQAVELAQRVIGAAVEVERFVKLGAQVQSMEIAFRQLGGSTAQLNQIRSALAGSVDDATIMKLTNTAKSLGVAEGQIAQFAKVAQVKAAQMGTSVEHMFNSLITGVARRSVLLIDNAGIMMKGAAGDVEKYLNDMGTSSKAASVALQTQAFGAVTLARANVDLAATSEAPINAVLRFEATLINLKNEMASSAADLAMPFLADAADKAAPLSDILKDLMGAVGKLVEAQMPLFRSALMAVSVAGKVAVPVIEAFAWWADKMLYPTKKAADLVDYLADKFSMLADDSTALSEAADNARVSLEKIAALQKQQAEDAEKASAKARSRYLMESEMSLGRAQLLQEIGQTAVESAQQVEGMYAALGHEKATEALYGDLERIDLLETTEGYGQELVDARANIYTKMDAIDKKYADEQAKKGRKSKERKVDTHKIDVAGANYAVRQTARGIELAAQKGYYAASTNFLKKYNETRLHLYYEARVSQSKQQSLAIDAQIAAEKLAIQANRQLASESAMAVLAGVKGFAIGARARNIISSAEYAAHAAGALVGSPPDFIPNIPAAISAGMASIQYGIAAGVAGSEGKSGAGASASASSSAITASRPRSPSDSRETRDTKIVQLMVNGRVLGEEAIKGANKSRRFGGQRLDSRLVMGRGRALG